MVCTVDSTKIHKHLEALITSVESDAALVDLVKLLPNYRRAYSLGSDVGMLTILNFTDDCMKFVLLFLSYIFSAFKIFQLIFTTIKFYHDGSKQIMKCYCKLVQNYKLN